MAFGGGECIAPSEGLIEALLAHDDPYFAELQARGGYGGVAH